MAASRSSRPGHRIVPTLGLSMMLLLLTAVLSTASASAQHPPGGGGSIIPTIVKVSDHQVSDAARNREIGGYNCNFYTTALGLAGTGDSCSHNSWKSEEWCADFAKWVYRTAGAQTNGLSSLASSGYTYGTTHHTWHTTGPKVGDLAVFASRHHIGVVTKVSGTNVLVVSGNTYRPGQSSGPADAAAAHWASVSDMWGFASPVAAPA